MPGFTIERDWITAAGLRAVAIFNDRMGFRCGYVGVPVGHPLHGIDYMADAPLRPVSPDTLLGQRSIQSLLCFDQNTRSRPEYVFDVHGSLTYSGSKKGNYPVESPEWWFGFDCGHAGDATALSKHPECVERDLAFVVDQCESLARQIVEKTVHPKTD